MSKEEVKTDDQGRKRTSSILIGLKLSEEKTYELVIGPEHECRTVDELKKVIVDNDIEGAIYIVRQKPIRRIIKQQVVFA